MCFKQKDKWQLFLPTQEYLDVVKVLTSIAKLHTFIRGFDYTGEKGDVWQTPEEFLKNEHIDCEDFAIFAIDVLVRIIKLTEARFIVFSGYNHERNGKKLKGHAICAFPYWGKTAIFSNNTFHSGFNDYIEIGHKYYPDGLKRYEVRDYQGKILSKKNKLIGRF